MTCGRFPPSLRLEIGYALQCRVDANRTRTTPRSIKPLLDHLVATGAGSLLDRPLADWVAELPGRGIDPPRAFLGYAIERLLDLRDGTGWDNEYQRDVWRPRRLGIAGHDSAPLDFTAVQPPWLRELTKRWCRWRMSCGVGLQQVRKDRIALVRLSQFTPGLASSAGPGALDRAALEAYLARLAVKIPHPKTRSSDISAVTGFLHAVRQHRWASPPAEAQLYPSDHPRRADLSAPRAIPEFVMGQLEDPANLDRLTDPRIRLLMEILIRTGLRIGDATRLEPGLPDPRPAGRGLPALPQPQDASRRGRADRRRARRDDHHAASPRPEAVPEHRCAAAAQHRQPRRPPGHPDIDLPPPSSPLARNLPCHRRTRAASARHRPPIPAHGPLGGSTMTCRRKWSGACSTTPATP